MKNINNDVFLNKISQKIKEGSYDEHLIFPFMTRELFYTSIKHKIDKRISTGGTPILTDIEIKDCLDEVKETAINIIALYIKLGFIEKIDKEYKFTRRGLIALKASRSL